MGIPVYYQGEEILYDGDVAEVKINVNIVPIPIISIPAALLVDVLNKGEETLRNLARENGFEFEIISKNHGWDWEIYPISVKNVWFYYKFKVIKPATPTALPAAGVAAAPLMSKLAPIIIGALTAVIVSIAIVAIYIFLTKLPKGLGLIIDVTTVVIAGLIAFTGITIGYWMYQRVKGIEKPFPIPREAISKPAEAIRGLISRSS